MIYENDLNDFYLPYKIHGDFDKEVQKRKYQELTNSPKHYLCVRYSVRNYG